MVMLGKSALLRLSIDNQVVDIFEEWEELGVLASFNDDATQANITTDQITLVLNEASKIRQWILDGQTGGVGIFEGPSASLDAYNASVSTSIFEGFADLTNDFEDLVNNGRVKINLIKDNGLNQFDERLSALSYGFLENQGVFTSVDYTDVDYIVQKTQNLFEILMANIVLFLMIKELAESIKDSATAIADAVAHLTGGITGTIASAVFAIAIAVIQIAYTAFILVAVINLGTALIETLVPRKRTHKGLKLRTALSKVATHLGYDFVSPNAEFDKVHYLPSNPEFDEEDDSTGLIRTINSIKKGIPNVTDFGYRCSEMFELCKNLIDGKFAIIGNELHLRSRNDPFWVQTSTFQMPDVLLDVKRYNTQDLKANMFLAFETDITDDWTLDEFKGTNYERITDAINVNNSRAKLIKGLDEINFPVALGNRKDKLNGIENFLKGLATTIDNVSAALGGRSNLASRVTSKLGVLKVSTNNHVIPKLLYLEGGRIPVGHRDLFSAKSLYNKYHNYSSFVTNDFGFQRELYRNIEIPFGLDDFVKLINNSYFVNNDGRTGKVEKIEWNVANDKAVVDFWIQQPYTKNLKETFIEPG